MKGASRAMRSMNKSVDARAMAKIIADFEKESSLMDDKQVNLACVMLCACMCMMYNVYVSLVLHVHVYNVMFLCVIRRYPYTGYVLCTGVQIDM